MTERIRPATLRASRVRRTRTSSPSIVARRLTADGGLMLAWRLPLPRGAPGADRATPIATVTRTLITRTRIEGASATRRASAGPSMSRSTASGGGLHGRCRARGGRARRGSGWPGRRRRWSRQTGHPLAYASSTEAGMLSMSGSAVEIGVRVVSPDVVRGTRPANVTCSSRSLPGPEQVASCDLFRERQRGPGIAVLYQTERSQSARQVIKGFEVPR